MTAATTTMGAEDAKSPVQKSGKKKLILLAVPVLLVGVGEGLWFTGLVSLLPGMKHEAAKPMADAAPPPPTYVEMPQIVANLNAGPRRTSFVKLQARLELSKPEDVAAFTAAQPRVLDLFQTYLREMRPEELRGATGTYRLREELIARASLAMPGVHVQNVLFTEIIVQ
jgi:flagellar FliL protein